MRPATDRRLLRRAAVAVAVQAAVAVAIVVALVGVLVYVLDSREQARQADRMARNAAVAADDVGDPPSGVILLEQVGDRSVAASAGAPAALHRATSTLDSGFSTVRVGGVAYRVYVSERPDGTRYVALVDLASRHEDQRRLLWSLFMAGLVGVAGAGVVGGVVGWRAARPLGDALGMQRRFVADASHELRTPLTILHTRAQMLARKSAWASDDPDLHKQLHDLVADTRALGEVVEDLLLSAEFEHRPDRSEPVDVADLVRQVVRGFAPYAEQLGVSLTALSPDDGPVRVAGARPALHRALSALIDNALAHEHAGGTVTVTARPDGERVRLIVADDGEGLDPGEAAKLLRRFVRGESPAGHGRRFGLGLALVQEVVHAHDGTITIDGRPGHGASFTLDFPALR